MPKKKSSEKSSIEEVYDPIIQRAMEELFSSGRLNAGIKHDNLKPRWSLLPLNVLAEVIAVLEHGAKKYSIDNWMRVVNGEDRYYDAAMRHIQARKLGEINDPESRRPHLAHALCCLIFWLWFDLKNRRGHR
jgi:hypothetical protein